MTNEMKSTTSSTSNYPGFNSVPDAVTYGYANSDSATLENQAVWI